MRVALIRLLLVLAVILPTTQVTAPEADAFERVHAKASVSGRKVSVSAGVSGKKVASKKSSGKGKSSGKPVYPEGYGSCGVGWDGYLCRTPRETTVDGRFVVQIFLPTPWPSGSATSVASVAKKAALDLVLPRVAPKVGPDPGLNQWRMAVVGYPLWLWVDGPSKVSSSTVQDGIRVDLSARLDRVVFEMGDGGKVSCSRFAVYTSGVKPGTPSPSCGYVYQKASLPKGTYRVSATAHWVVDWSAAGLSGSLEVPVNGTRELPVGELQAVIVG